MMTRSTILAEGIQALDRAQIAEAGLDAWLLLADCLHIDRVEYFTYPNKIVSEKEYRKYVKYIEERTIRKPLQYIMGKQEFMGFTFRVNPAVLIPRQDTEILVEEALKEAERKSVLDLCTGSGCIIISLYKLANVTDALGTDISPKALEVASYNAKKLDADIDFKQSDLWENISGSFDMIISNPPYIESKEINRLQPEVKDYEPRQALDGKKDGLYYYRKIIEGAGEYLNYGGSIYLEIGYNQSKSVVKLLQKEGFDQIRVKQDLAGIDRVVSAVWQPHDAC